MHWTDSPWQYVTGIIAHKKETSVLSTCAVNSAMWLCINVPGPACCRPACSTKVRRHKYTTSSVQSVMRQCALQHSVSLSTDIVSVLVRFEFVSASARIIQLSSSSSPSSSPSSPTLEIFIWDMVTRYQQFAIYVSRCGIASGIFWDVTLCRGVRGCRRFERW